MKYKEKHQNIRKNTKQKIAGHPRSKIKLKEKLEKKIASFYIQACRRLS